MAKLEKSLENHRDQQKKFGRLFKSISVTFVTSKNEKVSTFTTNTKDMFQKGKMMYSVVKGKCPRCHEGEFFEHPFTFNPTKITKLHKTCSECGLKYMIEPSFFYGAMYVNYALTVAIGVSTFVITKVILETSLLQAFLSVFVVLLLLAPINLRLSRILWINMFVKYNSHKKQ